VVIIIYSPSVHAVLLVMLEACKARELCCSNRAPPDPSSSIIAAKNSRSSLLQSLLIGAATLSDRRHWSTSREELSLKTAPPKRAVLLVKEQFTMSVLLQCMRYAAPPAKVAMFPVRVDEAR